MSKYDIEKFDLAPDPDLVCCICQCVLDKPVECPCRHVFCRVCIERWLTNRSNCPTCRKATYKHQLKPVLPLVQNMLNRLMMICDYRQNGCLDNVMLEHFDTHVKNCGYKMKTCRFSKCGKNILSRYLETHELHLCEHRELMCEGECGLMIPLNEKPSHNCVVALKAHIEEKDKMIDSLKVKLQELNSLSQCLNEELEQLRQLNDHPINLFNSTSTSSIDEDISSDFLSDFDDTSSISDDTINNDEVFNNDISADANVGGGNNDGTDVVEQVERTVVTSLFELSSRLERVRNQMRAVLNSGLVQDTTNLNDEVRIPSSALEAIVGNNNNSNSASNGLVSNATDLAIDDENINNNLIDNMDREANSQSERDGDNGDIPQRRSTSHGRDGDNTSISLQHGNGLTLTDRISNAEVSDSDNNQGHLEANNISLNCPPSYVHPYRGLNSSHFSPTFHHTSISPHNTGLTSTKKESHHNAVSINVPRADIDSLSIPKYTDAVWNYTSVTTRNSTNLNFQYASSSHPHVLPDYSATYPSCSPTNGYQLRNQTYSPNYNLSNPEYRALGSYIPTNITDPTSFLMYTPTSLGCKPTNPDSSPTRHIVITQPPLSPDIQYTDSFEKEKTESGHLIWSMSPGSPSDLHSRSSDLSSSIPSITSARNSPDRQPDLDSDSSRSVSSIPSFCDSLSSNSWNFSSGRSRICSPSYSSSKDSTSTALEGKSKILISSNSSPSSQHANRPSHSSSYSGRKSRLEFHNDSILSISSCDEEMNLLTDSGLNVKSETKFTNESDGSRPFTNLLRNFEHNDAKINGEGSSGHEHDNIRGNTLSWLNNVSSQNMGEQTSVDDRNRCENVEQFDITKKCVDYHEWQNVETPASRFQSVGNGNKKLDVLKPCNNTRNSFMHKEVSTCERDGKSQNTSVSATVKHNNVIERSGISTPIIISETSDSETSDLDALKYTEKHIIHGHTNDFMKSRRFVSNMECSQSTEQFADRSRIAGDSNQSHDFSHGQVNDYSHNRMTKYSHSQVKDYSHSRVTDDYSHSQITDTSDSRLNSLPWSQLFQFRKRRQANFDDTLNLAKKRILSSQKSAVLSPLHLSCSDTGLHFKNNKAKSNERSSIGQTNASSMENGQHLPVNVKIDLSLINFSGHFGTESSSSAVPNTTLAHSSTNFTPVLGNINMFRDNDNNKTKYCTSNGMRPVNRNGTHSPSFKHKASTLAKHDEKHYNKDYASATKVTTNTNILANRESQNMCLDDSDSSDFTWEPGSDIESDITITDEEETDSSYEVQVPKSTAALLEEYASDESDESWKIGMS